MKDYSSMLEILPHAENFRFVTDILHVEKDKILTQYVVPLSSFWIDSHFPNNPVMPGVLIIESMAQTSYLCYMHAICENIQKNCTTLLRKIDDTIFRDIVYPGDVLKIQATHIKSFANLTNFQCVINIDGKIVAKSKISLFTENI